MSQFKARSPLFKSFPVLTWAPFSTFRVLMLRPAKGSVKRVLSLRPKSRTSIPKPISATSRQTIIPTLTFSAFRFLFLSPLAPRFSPFLHHLLSRPPLPPASFSSILLPAIFLPPGKGFFLCGVAKPTPPPPGYPPQRPYSCHSGPQW